jgi:hypothetical protein
MDHFNASHFKVVWLQKWLTNRNRNYRFEKLTKFAVQYVHNVIFIVSFKQYFALRKNMALSLMESGPPLKLAENLQPIQSMLIIC